MNSSFVQLLAEPAFIFYVLNVVSKRLDEFNSIFSSLDGFIRLFVIIMVIIILIIIIIVVIVKEKVATEIVQNATNYNNLTTFSRFKPEFL